MKETMDSSQSIKSETLKDSWSIRPCSVYQDEYSDCTSFKARFHQYFIHGEQIDCTQWQKDFDNCERYRKENDLDAGTAVIKSEEERRNNRLRAHYANTTWKKRTNPPADWEKPLPEWLAKRYENTYLQFKQEELSGNAPVHDEVKQSYCTIM